MRSSTSRGPTRSAATTPLCCCSITAWPSSTTKRAGTTRTRSPTRSTSSRRRWPNATVNQPMSSEVEGTGPLAAEDARALSRLLRRTFGRGFRLVVIEVATPRLRQRILEWLGAEVEALRGEVLELDVGALPGQNLWSELVERLEQRDQGVERERVVLALHGFQAAARGQPDA